MTNSLDLLQRWETKVIHLNITNTPPEPPPAQLGVQNQPFSANYLKEEFPGHYNTNSPVDAQQSQHPAFQLQGFINGLGQDGWEFVGVFPIGQLMMMFFRRPSLVANTPLRHIIERLEALEASLTQSTKRPDTQYENPNIENSITKHDIGTKKSSNPRILSQLECNNLSPAPALPTSHAAEALGLRAAGGLSTYGSRYGFPVGLVKLVGNGMAAVYLGTQKRPSGGKSIRLWMVLPQSALPN